MTTSDGTTATTRPFGSFDDLQRLSLTLPEGDTVEADVATVPDTAEALGRAFLAACAEVTQCSEGAEEAVVAYVRAELLDRRLHKRPKEEQKEAAIALQAEAGGGREVGLDVFYAPHLGHIAAAVLFPQYIWITDREGGKEVPVAEAMVSVLVSLSRLRSEAEAEAEAD